MRGWLVRFGGGPLLVVHPVADAAAFTGLDDSARPPEGALALACHTEGVRYGALARGSRLRLFRTGSEPEQVVAATISYLKLDAADLRPEDRALPALPRDQVLLVFQHGPVLGKLIQAQRQTLHAHIVTALPTRSRCGPPHLVWG